MKTTVMSLIHDAHETFQNKRGGDHTFRVRVWRGVGRTPIVLVTQINEKGEPWMLSSKVANWVIDAILRHSQSDINYYESCRLKGQPLDIQALNEVRFSYFGKLSLRSRLIDPCSYPASWEALELLLGFQLED